MSSIKIVGSLNLYKFLHIRFNKFSHDEKMIELFQPLFWFYVYRNYQIFESNGEIIIIHHG